MPPPEQLRRSPLSPSSAAPPQPAPCGSKPRLLDRVRASLRVRGYSPRTEEAYVPWIRRYISFHKMRHPKEMGAAEITQFLTSLAVQRKVAAATQNQALSALLFLYREVLGQEVPWLDGIVHAKRTRRLPVVLTREEVRAVLGQLNGAPRLMALLLYGAGLRLLECARLRVKDIDFTSNQIVVRAARVTGTGSRCYLPPSRPISHGTSNSQDGSTSGTPSAVLAGSSFRGRCLAPAPPA